MLANQSRAQIIAVSYFFQGRRCTMELVKYSMEDTW